MKNKNKNYQLLPNNGFTLVELLLTMAIIVILSGTILISLSAQRKKAQESRALAELSGVMQPILMCRSDNGNINDPATGNVDICDLSTNYGTWPNTGAGSGLSEFSGYSSGNDVDASPSLIGNWYFHINDTTAYICCNSKSARCKQVGAACDENTDLTN